MKRQLILIVLILVCLSSVFAQRIVLPDGTRVKSKKVCGDCIIGNYGIPFFFTIKPYSPDIPDTVVQSTEKEIACSILGHTYPEDDEMGDHVMACSTNSLKSPFSVDDITRLGNSSGTNFNYSRKEKLNLNINAAVDANINQLKLYTSDTTKLKKIESKIRAAYSRMNGKELTIVGNYTEWALKAPKIEALIRGINFSDCKEWLRKQNYRVILSIGLLYFDINYNNSSVDSIANEIQATAQSEGIRANISVTFKREINESLTRVTKNNFQVMNWMSAGMDELHP